MSESSLPSVSALSLAIRQVRQDLARQESADSEAGQAARRRPGTDVAGRVREVEQMVNQVDRNLTAQRVALYQYQASLASIKTSDTVLGSLLSLSA
ncbi:MAG: hypothetical protein KA375_11855 [Vitreoscilla sp.]|nr:hypothetical protein [Vitreoscilla sp.]